MHICFIVDNSLPMIQKTSNNQIAIFDQVKFCLETVIKSLFQNLSNSFQQNKDVIHLFVTSSTQPISSYENNTQKHLINQVKNLQCTLPTFPADVIESALFHLGKFRCLNESETLLGYRDGTIFQPALIFYITGNSNTRQMTKIHRKIVQNKFHIRAEYKFITIKYCSVSPHETNFNNIEKFKSYIEKQKQSMMMKELMRKMNGTLHHVYQRDQMAIMIQNIICKHNPNLTMALSNKEYKIHNKEIVKIQFASTSAEQVYFQRLKTLRQTNTFYKDNDESSCDIFVNTIPMQRSVVIPLPHQLTSNKEQLNQNNIIINEFHNLKYFVDFTKEYVADVDPLMKYLFNVYQLGQYKKLANLCKDFTQQKKFPLFYQKKKSQYIIGYLRLSFQTLSNKMTRQNFQLHISFSNFLNLNSNIRSYKERQASSQQYFQNYISTLPLFYHKFLSFYLPNLNIILSPQSLQMFGDIRTLPAGVTNWKFYEQRLAEKKNLQIVQKKNYEQHEKNISSCCAVYSQHFDTWEAERSKFYAKGSNQPQDDQQSEVTKFFTQSFSNLQSIKKIIGIQDYLTVQNIQSRSMRKQLEKYSIRRDQDEMDQLVGDYLGNPFKKINKKVKINDEAQSVWVQPQQVSEMKQLLTKQIELLETISTHLPQKDRKEIEDLMKTDSIYDRLAEVKEKIAIAVKNKEISQRAVKDSQLIHEESSEQSNQKQTSTSINYTNNQKTQTNHQSYEGESLIQAQKYQQPSSQQSQISTEKGTKKQSEGNTQQKIETEQIKSLIPELIKEVNQKFKMNKSVNFLIPTQLVFNEQFLKNKNIINQVTQPNFNGVVKNK